MDSIQLNSATQLSSTQLSSTQLNSATQFNSIQFNLCNVLPCWNSENKIEFQFDGMKRWEKWGVNDLDTNLQIIIKCIKRFSFRF